MRPRRGLPGTRAIVRTHRPWRNRLLVTTIAVVACIAVASVAFEVGRRSTAGAVHGDGLISANVQLRQQLETLSADRDGLRASVDTAAAQLQMARAAQDSMAQQVKSAEVEIAQLKEDLGFFESLLPAPADTSGIHVRSFRVSRDDPSQAVHYRLLVMQGGSKAFVEQPEFRGELQFTISAIRGGRPLTLTLPQQGERALPAIRLKHYQRIEGDLPVPQDVEVRAISVRVMQGGQVRASQSATL